MAQRIVILVGAGVNTVKNSYKNYEADSLYLNFGLLGLATELEDKGYLPIVFQADEKNPGELIALIKEAVELQNYSYPVMLSIPSFYSVKWAALFVEQMKEKYPWINIVAGGRWVIDRNYEWIKSKLPQVSYFIKGCPDDCFEQFLDMKNWVEDSRIYQYSRPFTRLNYKLLYDYKQYQPIVEVARGCAGNCDFCLESHYKACGPKEPVQVLDEIEVICRDYGENELNFYLEGAIFVPDKRWAECFKEEYIRRGMKFRFRMQSRVDMMSTEAVKILAKAGLKVLDVGLESASPLQLERMGKTRNPEKYLQRAEKLLEVCESSGVWCKLNILLYAGENLQTVNETKEWLRKQKGRFKGLSCNPLNLYLNGEYTWSYVEKLECLSGYKVDRKRLLEEGYTDIRLSNEIDEQMSRNITNEFYEEFMKKEGYQELKEITYTRRSY